jgi:HEAT repeat protein
MIRYCPHCWKETPLDAVRCPHYGQSTDEGETDFVDRLISALRHPEPTRAGLAIDMLTEGFREPRAVQPLIALLGSTKDISVLVQAARGLGVLGDRHAVPALIEILKQPDALFVARIEAATSLGKLGGKDALAALWRAAYDTRASVAEAAAESPENIGRAGIRVKPIECLKIPSPSS